MSQTTFGYAEMLNSFYRHFHLRAVFNLGVAVTLRGLLLIVILMVSVHPVLAYESGESVSTLLNINTPPTIIGLDGVQMLQQRYPGARFQVVTRAQYEELKQRHSFPEYVVSQPLQVAVNDRDYGETEPRLSRGSSNCYEPRPSNVHVGGGADIHFGHINGGRGDGALIVIAIVGIILVAALVVYTVKFLVQAISGSFDCGLWLGSGAIGASVSGDGFYGGMGGVHFNTGTFNEKTHLGLSAELGGYAFTKETPNTDLHFGGAYWLVGPVIHFGSIRSGYGTAFSLEFLGGHSFTVDLGAMSLLRFNVTTSLGDAHLGFSGGLLYVDIADDSGVLENTNEYNSYFGVEFGTTF
ncbi:MAG: hypothetical protein OEZ68_12670 [Gammaproteobacteria bacterium]|nr:hypothetical protein [Gammaproteobacteria bacterium]MDH5801650.1 hypothetical protein [Gammaproteobacteria bacterium]